MPLTSRFFPVVVAILLALGAFVTATAHAGADAPPSVLTKAPTAITATGATLHGVVTPNGKDTSAWFEVGTTTSYNSFTRPVQIGHGGSPASVDVPVTGLTAGTTYHVRVVGMNNKGIAHGADVVFTTLGAAAPPPAPAPAPTDPQTPAPAPAQPELGHTVTVAGKSGSVMVRVPGAKTAVPVTATSAVPVNSVVDTRQGSVVLQTAVAGAKTQAATIHGGVFQVRQSATKGGLTDLVLRGPAPTCKAGGARAAAVSKKRTKARSLWASDNHGRFRTRGSNAVATVRGTSWYMAERCDGTYTRVSHGVVNVKDLHTGRTYVLHAGQSHLARPAHH